MNLDVKVRWNTRCNDNHLYWRVIVDDVETLCSDVKISVPTYTTCDEVYDTILKEKVIKHHISCKANTVQFFGDKVIIK